MKKTPTVKCTRIASHLFLGKGRLHKLYKDTRVWCESGKAQILDQKNIKTPIWMCEDCLRRIGAIW